MTGLTAGQLAAGGVPAEVARVADVNPMGFLAGMVVLGLVAGGALLWVSMRCSTETVRGINGEQYPVGRVARWNGSRT